MVPTEVSDEETTFDASVVPVNVPAGAITTLVEAAVIKPLPFTVNDGIAVELPNAPVLLFTVASVAATEPGPVAVTSPVNAVIADPLFVRLLYVHDQLAVPVPDVEMTVNTNWVFADIAWIVLLPEL